MRAPNPGYGWPGHHKLAYDALASLRCRDISAGELAKEYQQAVKYRKNCSTFKPAAQDPAARTEAEQQQQQDLQQQ
jgi:hypothetical protein